MAATNPDPKYIKISHILAYTNIVIDRKPLGVDLTHPWVKTFGRRLNVIRVRICGCSVVGDAETTLHCKTVRFSKCLKAGGESRADRPAGFLYQWHKFPFHAVDWAIGSGIGIGLLLLVSLTILDFTRKHSLLSVSPSVSLAKLQGMVSTEIG